MPNKDEIEDAIKVLSQPSVEYIYPHGASQINMVRTDIRNLAITALQAMNQPECEICRLFEKKYTLTDKDGDCYMIRFCPNCGRELKGGE